MTDETMKRLQWYFEQRQYDEVLVFLHSKFPNRSAWDWNMLELAGQAYRYTNRLPEARSNLEASLHAGGKCASVYLALGIVLQMQGELTSAISSFEMALESEPEFDLAHNSLALTYKYLRRFEDALRHYDKALDGFSRRLAFSLDNRDDNAIQPYINTNGELWYKKTIQAALFLAASKKGIDALAWPTGEQAEKELQTRAHGGLLWKVVNDTDGKQTMYFLPNFFNTVRAKFAAEPTYAILLNNIGSVLADLGRIEEARQCFKESIEFTPDQMDYEPPRIGLKNLDETFG